MLVAGDVLRADSPMPRLERTGRDAAGRPTRKVSLDTTIKGCSHRGWGGLDMDDAAANADGDRLCSIFRAELVHDVFDVNLHRLFRDRKALANVPISVALGNPQQDLDLALGQ